MRRADLPCLFCPYCGSADHRVVNSRPSTFEDVPARYRQRKCLGCDETYRTYEMTEEDLENMLANRETLKGKRTREAVRDLFEKAMEVLS